MNPMPSNVRRALLGSLPAQWSGVLPVGQTALALEDAFLKKPL